MFDNYKEFEEIILKKSEYVVDLNEIEISPTLILPLLCECNNQNLKLSNGDNAFDYLVSKLDVDLFFKLPQSREESDQTDFITNFLKNVDSKYGGYFVLRHIVSELVNNVYDHSKGDNDKVQSYVLSKEYENENKLDISVVDDGISIPGRFEKSNVVFSDDCQAIEKAIGTFSTVSHEYYERGNGFWTIIKFVIEGNSGEILIISRNGCLHINGDDHQYYLLEDNHEFNGTLVNVRLNKYEVQNIYNLLESKKKSYGYVSEYDY